ncbi:MAG: MFS transporter [Pseudomonadota bacterium]|nr:MFS transporter [Pseudomonadota bacterium]
MIDARGARAGTREGVTLIFPIVLAVAGAVLIAPVIPSISRAFQDSPHVEVLVPVAITMPALMLALFSPIAGGLADRLGRRNLLVAALAVYSFVGTAPLWLASLPLIIASRALLGVCESMIVICSTALIGDYFSGAERERWLGYQAGVAAISAVIFILIGGALGETNWRAPFAAYAVAAVLIAPILLFIREPAAHAHAAVRAKIDFRLLGSISAIAFVASVMFMVVPIQLGFLLERHGPASPETIGMATAANSFTVAVTAFLFQRLTGVKFSVMAAAALLFLAAGLAVIAWSSTFPVATLGSAVHGIGWGLALPALLSWAMQPLPQDVRGRGAGVFMGAVFIGQFLSPLIVLAFKAGGDLTSAVLTMAAICALTAPAAILYGRSVGEVRSVQ